MKKIKSIRTSSLPRYALCPGALAAAEGLESKSSPESEMGDRIHLALESHYLGVEFDETRLSDRESMVYRWFMKEADALIEKHGGAKQMIPELDLGHGHAIPGTDILLTGHIDLVVICNDGTTIVLDWKSGFLEVPPAQKNVQLMGYVWLFSQEAAEHPDYQTEVINSYLFSSGNEKAFTGATCGKDVVESIGNYITTIAKGALDPDAKRVPGTDQCKYCPAAGTDNCFESKEYVEQAAIGLELMKTEAAQLPADKLEVVRIFTAIKQVESIGKKFLSRLKEEVMTNPEAWTEHFELKQGNKVRTIIDVQGAYDKIVGGADLVTAVAFLNNVELPIGNLEALLKPALLEAGIKVKDQRDHITSMLGDLLEVSQNKPSIKLLIK